MNKAMIPNDLEEYRKLNGEFNEMTKWKIMTKIDEIAHNRRKKLERDRSSCTRTGDRSCWTQPR